MIDTLTTQLNFDQYKNEVEKNLKTLSLNSEPADLYDPIRYMLSLGGKHLRPVLTLAGCELMGGNYSSAINAAIAIEVFHNFTLLHDDIMDEAPLRRGKATVHKKWNTSIAILSGDAMFVKSYEYLIQNPDHTLKPLITLFNTTALEVCEGQQLDMDFENRDDVSIKDYIHMIMLKTAVLLASSLKTGAILANASLEDQEHIYQFGKHVGISFQLQDDLLDLYADKAKFGKQIGGDIVSNKKTYLLLKALEVADDNTRASLNSLMQDEVNPDEKIKKVKGIFDELNVGQLTQKEMEQYFNKGIAHLNQVSCNEALKKQLLNFTKQLMVRES